MRRSWTVNVRDLSVIGATGSVGTQSLDVIRAHPDSFRVVGLAAGSRLDVLAGQAVEFGVPAIGLAVPPAGTDAEAVAAVRQALTVAAAQQGRPDPVEVIELGPEAPARISARPASVVLNAVTGAVGLDVTLAALEAGTDVALANKESLIIGGEVVLEAARASGAALIPVDSEHSAIAQALRSGREDEVARLIVTASGGPFRGCTRAQLETVTPQQALAHPTWDMGRVITTNSASLVNKGLEVIEAHLLFGVPYDRIEVVVHPQSQVHSMVEFTDGSTIAQVSPPDMRLPIAYALGAGHRLASGAQSTDWSTAATTMRSPPWDSRSRRGDAAERTRPCTTRRTRCWSTPSTSARSPSRASRTGSRRSSRSTAGRTRVQCRREPATHRRDQTRRCAVPGGSPVTTC